MICFELVVDRGVGIPGASHLLAGGGAPVALPLYTILMNDHVNVGVLELMVT